jgi:hypothetical protein
MHFLRLLICIGFKYILRYIANDISFRKDNIDTARKHLVYIICIQITNIREVNENLIAIKTLLFQSKKKQVGQI